MLASKIWEAALGELQLQVSKPNFDTWLKDTTGVSYQGDIFLIGVPNIFIAEWLKNRLYSLIGKTIVSITGKSVDIQFLIQSPSLAGPQPTHAYQADGGTSTKLREPVQSSKLNPRYTFDTFITGESNRLAYTAALEVAEKPGLTYNPLFIYGDVGIGKTHLLHAIGNATKARGLRTIYVSTEQFTNEFVIAVRNDHIEDFRRKFRNADVLLIDDIQFLGGKAQTQECVFHTFNDLYNDSCQIVITCDRPPKALSPLNIQKKLGSRLAGGLVADIQPPDLETRLTILDVKAKQLKAPILPEVLHFLATQFTSSVRELEGALTRLITYAKLSGGTLNKHLATQALTDMIAKDDKQKTLLPPKTIINTVANYYDLPLESLLGRRRDRKTALARQIAMYLLREQNHCRLAEIGKSLGDRDHTTVLHGCEKIATEININTHLSDEIKKIQNQLKNLRKTSF